jgi:hypothetical protein
VTAPRLNPARARLRRQHQGNADQRRRAGAALCVLAESGAQRRGGISICKEEAAGTFAWLWRGKICQRDAASSTAHEEASMLRRKRQSASKNIIERK